MARRSRILMFGLPILTLMAGVGALVSIARNQPVSQSALPINSPPVQPGPRSGEGTRAFVGATGIVEPAGQEIALGSHTAGIVSKVLVQPGMQVTKGDALFVIDERAALAQLAIRQAELDAAIRRRDDVLARSRSVAAARDAALAAAQAARVELEELRDQLRSGEDLQTRTGNTAITARELTNRRNAERSAAARLAEADARAAQAEAELGLVANLDAPTIAVETANINQARQSLKRAQVDLDLLTVRAPEDATVLQVNVRAGEFAQAGTVTTPLMVIGNLSPLHVRVDIDEVDIGLFRPEAKAYASLRGQTDRRAELSFVRIDPIVVPKKSLSGAAAERVDTRVLRVVYSLPKGVLSAYAGQQVDVFIEANQTAGADRPDSVPISR